MAEKSIPQTFFNPSRCSDKAASPDIPEQSHYNGDANDIHCIDDKVPNIDTECSEIINGPFDDPWNKKLKKIDGSQTEDTEENNKPVFNKIRLYQFDRFHWLKIVSPYFSEQACRTCLCEIRQRKIALILVKNDTYHKDDTGGIEKIQAGWSTLIFIPTTISFTFAR